MSITKKLLTLIIISFLSAQAKVKWPTLLDKEPWNERNNPFIINSAHINTQYNYKYTDLKAQNQLTFIPWTDDYWPTYKGGISNRWNNMSVDWYSQEKYSYNLLTKEEVKNVMTSELSPSEKYDIFLKRYDFPLTRHERNRTNILKTVEGSREYDPDFQIPTWEGLCHGWAPATLLYKNPKPVSIKNDDGVEIDFGSSDIKALLTFFLHYEKSAQTKFLGERCDTNFSELEELLNSGEISEKEYQRRLIADGCADINPGAFHVILANEIKEDRGFIIDITRDQEVWNQPVYAYHSNELSRRSPNDEEYKYGARNIIKIEMVVSYVVENAPEWHLNIDHRSYSRAHYEYELDIDESGNIIGGKWISFERPDFLWMQKAPSFRGFFKGLEQIYLKSISI